MRGLGPNKLGLTLWGQPKINGNFSIYDVAKPGLNLNRKISRKINTIVRMEILGDQNVERFTPCWILKIWGKAHCTLKNLVEEASEFNLKHFQ